MTNNTEAKIANAEKLAALNADDAARYEAAGNKSLAAHHRRLAEKWAANAADLRGDFR